MNPASPNPPSPDDDRRRPRDASSEGAREGREAGPREAAEQALLDALPMPALLYDADLTVQRQNRLAVEAFRQTGSSASLRSRFRAPEIIELLERSLRTGHGALERWTERGGSQRVWAVRSRSVAGAPVRFLLTFVDRSDVVAAERMRSDFIANASHELRTPLTSINGFIETLRGPAKNDAAMHDKFLSIMAEQTGRMSRLIEDLLSLSRLETRAVRERVPVEPAAMVEQVVHSLSHLAEEAGVRIEMRCDADLPILHGARDELIQVIENLVENALKYGAEGGRIIVHAEATLLDGRRAVAFGVEDFGGGIAEEHLPRLTERFYRVDVSRSRARRGTGLGLAIVKHILQRHEGTLSIRSTPSVGSTFRAIVPIERNPRPASTDIIETTGERSLAPTSRDELVS